MMNSIERVDVVRSKVGPRLRQLFGLLAMAGVLAGSPSCSVIVDTNADQCASNSDCASRGEYSVCGAARICVKPTNVAECTTNQQCLDKGPNQICRGGECVSLTTQECQTVDGDPSRDDAFLFASVLPTEGGDAVFGKPVELAIQLALSEIKNQLSGIPTATPGVNRPILYISCNDNSDTTNDTIIKVMKHLTEKLHVPAIIGEAFSGTTQYLANDWTIGNDTLLISPAATSDTITGLNDNDLVWRTSPPDTLQSAALKLYGPKVEEKTRGRFVDNNMAEGTPVKVAIIHNGDPYGIGLADGLLSSSPTPPLQINGKAVNDSSNKVNYLRLQYDENDGADQIAKANQVAKVFQPHIVFLFGFTEAIGIMNQIDGNWGGDAKLKPLYVFSDGVLGSDLTKTVNTNSDLRSRVTGTVPGTTNPQFTSFVERYELKYTAQKADYPANTFGAAGGYDSVFLLAYATATLNGKPETGENLAQGLKKLSDPAGLQVDAGASNMSAGIAALISKGTINYNGASGPLDFDPKTGEASSDIQIWCLPTVDMTMTGDAQFSGLYYDAANSKLSGMQGNCQ